MAKSKFFAELCSPRWPVAKKYEVRVRRMKIGFWSVAILAFFVATIAGAFGFTNVTYIALIFSGAVVWTYACFFHSCGG